MSKRILTNFLSILIPIKCVVCLRRISAGPICGYCNNLKDFEIIRDYCRVCSTIFEGSELICPLCTIRPPIVEAIRALWWYRDNVAWMIRAAKYKPSLKLTRIAAGALAEATERILDGLTPTNLIIPLPSSQSSLLQRGFNQSEILAHFIALRTKIEIDLQSLKLHAAAQRRAAIAREKRTNNFAGKFRVRQQRVIGKRILLVDDVVTTGATAAAATRALLSSGASAVQLICLARAPGELTALRQRA